ncbi:hypothetical protein B0H17DRAFT_1153083 [Mycena rosella]|uniref:Uncharacterized protein n=1 Tax=Mycena rosella TaxID=1033263 RepID=A0AAD7B9A2_MYCRO|nr:hypothetical protein B0H17DRAFT_1153083 [Mycena rosella]
MERRTHATATRTQRGDEQNGDKWTSAGAAILPRTALTSISLRPRRRSWEWDADLRERGRGQVKVTYIHAARRRTTRRGVDPVPPRAPRTDPAQPTPHARSPILRASHQIPRTRVRMRSGHGCAPANRDANARSWSWRACESGNGETHPLTATRTRRDAAFERWAVARAGGCAGAGSEFGQYGARAGVHGRGSDEARVRACGKRLGSVIRASHRIRSTEDVSSASGRVVTFKCGIFALGGGGGCGLVRAWGCAARTGTLTGMRMRRSCEDSDADAGAERGIRAVIYGAVARACGDVQAQAQ